MFLKKFDVLSFIIKKLALHDFVKFWEDCEFLSRFVSL